MDARLASSINKSFHNRLKSEKLKEKLTTYVRPDNCEVLTVPRVNPEIWDLLDTQSKASDLKLSQPQKTIVAATVAITQAADKLLQSTTPENESMINEALKMQLNAVGLLGSASFELSLKRRNAIKPKLSRDYASLSSSQVPITDMLFGDDLQKHLKDIKEINKIGHLVGTSSRRPGPQYYENRGRKPQNLFLRKNDFQNNKRGGFNKPHKKGGDGETSPSNPERPYCLGE